MKTLTIVMAVLAASILGSTFGWAQNNSVNSADESLYMPGEVYIKVSDDVLGNFSKEDRQVVQGDFPFLDKALEGFPTDYIIRSFYFSSSDFLRRTIRLRLTDPSQIHDLMSSLKGVPEVEEFARIGKIEKAYTPNDILNQNGSPNQWNLHKVNAPQAWDITQGNSNIILAIVDDAVRTNHNDIQNNIVAGRDVANDDSNPNPPSNSNLDFDHGTHVAGIAGAVTDNGIGIASLGNSISIMPVKAKEDGTTGSGIGFAYEGVAWATENGADVINMSWGSTTTNSFNDQVITNAIVSGVVLVAAAGNTGDNTPNYPAHYSNVISVANTNSNDEVVSSSSFGTSVDISAPGTFIYSTTIDGNYGYKSGTSMASPLVASLAALILSVDPSMNMWQVESCIEATSVDISNINPSFNGLIGTGRIDAYAAVCCASGGGCSVSGTEDITVENIQLSTFTAQAGDQITIDCDQVYSGNVFDANLPSFRLNYYINSSCSVNGATYLENDLSGLGSDDPVNHETETLTLPSNLPPGTHVIVVECDADNDLIESDENNTFCVTIQITSGGNNGSEDITVENIQLSAYTAQAGYQITIDCDQVYSGNVPDANLPSFRLNYYINSSCSVNGATYLENDLSGLGSDDPVNHETETLTLPSNLPPGTHVIVVECDADNDLIESDENNTFCVTIQITGGECGVPQNLIPQSINPTMAVMEFDDVIGVISYELRYRALGTNNWTTTFPTQSFYQAFGLSCLTTYEFQVRAECANGTSIWSGMQTFTTANCLLPNLYASTGSVNVNSNSVQIQLGVSNNGQGIAGPSVARFYASLDWSENSSEIVVASANVPGLAPNETYMIDVEKSNLCNAGLLSGVLYYFRYEVDALDMVDELVETENEYDISTVPYSFNCGAQCSPPINILHQPINPNSVQIDFNDVLGATSYGVRYRQAGTSNWTTVYVAQSLYQAFGLNCLTIYEFQVMTVCSSESSPWSSLYTFTTSGCSDNHDFSIANFVVSASVASPGQNITADLTHVYNGTSTVSVYPEIGYFLVSSCNLSGFEEPLDTDVSVLSVSNTSENEHANILIPNGLAEGLYYVVAASNYNGLYSESNWANNNVCASIQIVATASPDLEATMSTLGPYGPGNSLVFFDIEVTNTGNAYAPESYTGIYASTDSDISTSDIHLVTFQVPFLAPGESYWVSATGFDLCGVSGLPNGAYYYGYVIDESNLVQELNGGESNNAYEITFYPNEHYCSSVEVLETESSTIRLFPNPASDYVQISGLQKDSHFEILDGQGKRVKSGRVSLINSIIDFPDLAEGVYVLRIIKDEVLMTQKLIVSK